MKDLSKKRGTKRDKTFSILQKAWDIQSRGLRAVGFCVGCGSSKTIVAGHMIHGGKGKAWNRVDFNVTLPAFNVFPQCSHCNTFNPDGNGLLRNYFNRKYFNANELYDNLRALKQIEWLPTEDDAREVLRLTQEMYGKEIDYTITGLKVLK